MATIFDPAAELVKRVAQSEAQAAAKQAGSKVKGKRVGGKFSNPSSPTGWSFVNPQGRTAVAKRVRPNDKLLTNQGGVRARQTPVAYGPIKAMPKAQAAPKKAAAKKDDGRWPIPYPTFDFTMTKDYGGGTVLPGITGADIKTAYIDKPEPASIKTFGKVDLPGGMSIGGGWLPKSIDWGTYGDFMEAMGVDAAGKLITSQYPVLGGMQGGQRGLNPVTGNVEDIDNEDRVAGALWAAPFVRWAGLMGKGPKPPAPGQPALPAGQAPKQLPKPKPELPRGGTTRDAPRRAIPLGPAPKPQARQLALFGDEAGRMHPAVGIAGATALGTGALGAWMYEMRMRAMEEQRRQQRLREIADRLMDQEQQ